MAQIFISYQRSDRELAREIDRALTSRGLTVWWDENVNPRVTWDREIQREIEAAESVLVLWSVHSVESEWVREEAAFAKQFTPSKLIQLRFDNCTIPIGFGLRQFIDVPREGLTQSPGWSKLMSWLNLPPEPSPPEEAEPVGIAPLDEAEFEEEATPLDDIAPEQRIPLDQRETESLSQSLRGYFDRLPEPVAFVLGTVVVMAFVTGLVWVGGALWTFFQGDDQQFAASLPSVIWAAEWGVIGLIAGFTANFVIPGRSTLGCLSTIAFGIAGAMLATLVSGWVGWSQQSFIGNLIATILGTIPLVAGYRLIRSP